MHKSNKNNALRERNGLRILVAISLTIFLAGLGACTTNYTPGNGQPTGSTAYGAGTHASTYGSSSGTEGVKPQSRMIVAPEVITPMFSSSSEAIAVLAGHEGRFLGYASPGQASTYPGNQIVTGQVIPPALTANPQQTVNSSISSDPTPVITGGDGGGAAVFLGGVSSTGAVTSGVTSATTSAVTAASTLAAPVFGTSTTAATPTSAATAATVTQSTGFLTPTVTSAQTPTPTTAANPAIGNVGTASNATTSAVTSTPAVGTTTTRTGSGTLSVGRQVNFPATVSTSAAVTSPVTVSPTVTTVRSRAVAQPIAITSSRSRAVAQPVAITAPVTSSGRVARPVRMTTTGGSVVITNQ